jgi:hypothetical protein
MNGGVLAYGMADWCDIFDPQERRDWVAVGRRGSGKTALACAIAQGYLQQGREVFALQFPKTVAASLGFQSLPLTDWHKKKDCCILLDETQLRVKRGKGDEELQEHLALARQNNVAHVYTAQGLSSVNREILRMDATLLCKHIDPLASRFEREETADLLRQVVAIQAKIGAAKNPAATLCYTGAGWLATATPLPQGWTSEISKLWR